MKQAMAVIYMSDDQKDWVMVKPADVPDWVKQPDVMGRLLRGEIAQNTHAGLALPSHIKRPWYRAELVKRHEDLQRIAAAARKRGNRQARRRGALQTTH